MFDCLQIQAYPTPEIFISGSKGKITLPQVVGPCVLVLASITTPTIEPSPPISDTVPTTVALSSVITGGGTQHTPTITEGTTDTLVFNTIATPTRKAVTGPSETVPANLLMTTISTPIKESDSISDSVSPNAVLTTVTI